MKMWLTFPFYCRSLGVHILLDFWQWLVITRLTWSPLGMPDTITIRQNSLIGWWWAIVEVSAMWLTRQVPVPYMCVCVCLCVCMCVHVKWCLTPKGAGRSADTISVDAFVKFPIVSCTIIDFHNAFVNHMASLKMTDGFLRDIAVLKLCFNPVKMFLNKEAIIVR